MAQNKKRGFRHKKRDSAAIQKSYCTYLLLNVGFLFPFLLITEFPDQVYAVLSVISKFIIINFFLTYGVVATVFGFLDLAYWCLAFVYSFYRLTYLHFAVLLVFLGFSVYRLIKEKNWKRFFLILFLTILSAALNYYWLIHGDTYPLA